MAISALIGLVAAITLSDRGQAADALPGWLAGQWVCREEMLASGPLVRSETWAFDDWSGLTGHVRGGLARGGSSLSEISLSRIIDPGEGLILSYSVAGGPVREFRAIEINDNVLAFEAEGGGAPGASPIGAPRSRSPSRTPAGEGGAARSWRYTRAGGRIGMAGC